MPEEVLWDAGFVLRLYVGFLVWQVALMLMAGVMLARRAGARLESGGPSGARRSER